MVGVWEGLNLGSIPNFFLCFGMHPKIIDVYPKLIPKGGVVQFCHILSPTFFIVWYLCYYRQLTLLLASLSF